MSRYFVNNSQIQDNRITIIGEDFQHLKKVLRVQRGDIITVCCDQFDYKAEIDDIKSDSIISDIIDKYANLTEPEIKITLFQGLPKSDKMELIVQKSVELGVYEIIPVITERCITKINTDKDAQNKAERWQKIALEAAKQCNRGIIPKVGNPIKFRDAVKQAENMDLSIIPYEKESSVNFKDIASGLNKIRSASVFIGPEGGFSEQEIQQADSSGVKKITLGPRILRTETAGLVAVSIMMYELGDVSNGRNKICGG